jgi:UDP:flavonoid glycosyltransferase YjiC (YdhE family)
MRVLFTTTGFPGHLLPLAPFAQALGRVGDEVALAGPRSAAPLATRLGLRHCACADPPRDELRELVASVAQRPREEGHARMMAEGFAGIAARAMEGDLLRLVGAWRPAVVVRESQEFAGALAAERHGVPAARVALGLASTEAETLALVAPRIDELRADLGLAADPGGERLGSSPCLTLVPPGLDGPGDGGPGPTHRFREPEAKPARLPDWWAGAEGPLVYVSFGSVAAELGFFPALYRAVLEALAELPVRVLVTTGEAADPAALKPLPVNAHAKRWVAQGAALANAAAVVCHGGYGSTLGALAHGRPLALIPLFGGDQWHNARRVAETGAAIALEDPGGRAFLEPPAPETIAAVAPAVRRLLDGPGYDRAAARIAADIGDLPPVDEAPAVLRALTSSRASEEKGVRV